MVNFRNALTWGWARLQRGVRVSEVEDWDPGSPAALQRAHQREVGASARSQAAVGLPLSQRGSRSTAERGRVPRHSRRGGTQTAARRKAGTPARWSRRRRPAPSRGSSFPVITGRVQRRTSVSVLRPAPSCLSLVDVGRLNPSPSSDLRCVCVHLPGSYLVSWRLPDLAVCHPLLA